MLEREPFVAAVALPPDQADERVSYPWELPAVVALTERPLNLHPPDISRERFVIEAASRS